MGEIVLVVLYNHVTVISLRKSFVLYLVSSIYMGQCSVVLCNVSGFLRSFVFLVCSFGSLPQFNLLD